jgi:serine/threonine protein kinase
MAALFLGRTVDAADVSGLQGRGGGVVAPEEASQTLRPLRADDPTTVAGYRIIARFGEDDTGAVFLAEAPSGRLVAIKLVHEDLARDPEFRLRFRREVQAAPRAKSLYAASIIDSESDGRQPWLATDYVAGSSLHDVVATYGPLPMDGFN